MNRWDTLRFWSDRGTMINIQDPLFTVRGVFIRSHGDFFKTCIVTERATIDIVFRATDVFAIKGRTVILRDG